MKRILTTLSKKWPEYLLEILVLIIGIYGGFALEEWGDNLNKREQEQVILRQLVEDFEANKKQLNEKIEMRETIIASGITLLKEFDNKGAIESDSLFTCLAIITLDPTFDPVNSDLVGSGNIHLIQNKRLTKLLSKWTSDIVAVKEIENVWQTMSYESFAPFLIKAGLTRALVNSFWKDTHPTWGLDKNKEVKGIYLNESKQDNIKDISRFTEIDGYASMAISLNNAANEQSTTLMERIDEILELLKSEIRTTQPTE